MNLNPLLLLLPLDGDGACRRVEKEATIVRFRAAHHAPAALGLGLEVGAEEEAANGYSKATRAPPFSMVAPLPDPLVLRRILPSAAGFLPTGAFSVSPCAARTRDYRVEGRRPATRWRRRRLFTCTETRRCARDLPGRPAQRRPPFFGGGDERERRGYGSWWLPLSP
jgi:hypothetical protein